MKKRKKWWGFIKETYKEHPEETQWIHLLSLGYVTYMLYPNKKAKQWWHKSDICSLCQQGKDDILHLFEDYSTIRILKKMMLGSDRIGIKLLIVNPKDNHIYRKKWGFYQKGT